MTAFSSNVATELRVAHSTQNQGLSTILFLYTEVLGRERAALGLIPGARKQALIPLIPSRAEVRAILG